MALPAAALRLWTGLATWAVDAALGARRKVVLNAGVHAHDCSRTDVVTDLRVCLTRLVGAYARPDGGVDYDRLAADADFAAHTERAECLQAFDPDVLATDDERLAFWLNLYNSLTIDSVVRGPVIAGMRGCLSRFRRVQYVIGGQRFSLDDIEHGILRGNRGHPKIPGPHFSAGDPRAALIQRRVDPRLHMALNCAARSCPPIGAYRPEALDAQLELAAAGFVNGGAATYDADTQTLCLSRIFKWYATDFGGRAGVIDFLRRYADPPLAAALDAQPAARIRWQDYDWQLNAA